MSSFHQAASCDSPARQEDSYRVCADSVPQITCRRCKLWVVVRNGLNQAAVVFRTRAVTQKVRFARRVIIAPRAEFAIRENEPVNNPRLIIIEQAIRILLAGVFEGFFDDLHNQYPSGAGLVTIQTNDGTISPRRHTGGSAREIILRGHACREDRQSAKRATAQACRPQGANAPVPPSCRQGQEHACLLWLRRSCGSRGSCYAVCWNLIRTAEKAESCEPRALGPTNIVAVYCHLEAQLSNGPAPATFQNGTAGH